MRETATRDSEQAGADSAVASRAPAVAGPAVQEVLRLQRKAGNRAATAMVLARRESSAKLEEGEVMDLQAGMNQLDEVVTPLVVDGIYGKLTRRAAGEFRAANKCEPGDRALLAAVQAASAEPQEGEKIAKKLFALGAAAYDRGRYGVAADYFERAGELADRPGLVFSRAQALRRMGGDRDKAVALYEQYLASGHGERDKDARSALAELKGAPTGDAEKDTASSKAAFMKGAQLYEAGRYGQAADQFAKARDYGERAGLIFSMAQALRRMGGKRKEAIALYKQYLTTDNPERAADAKAGIEELEGTPTGDETADVAAAKGEFDKGVGEYQKGKYGRAADKFAKAHDLADRPALLFSKAQALRRAGGHRAEAIALYEAYAEAGGERADEARRWIKVLREQGSAG